MTIEVHVPIGELAHHGATEPVINALRRCGIHLIGDLRAALDRYDSAVASGRSSTQYLATELFGIGVKRFAAARTAFENWAASQSLAEETL